MKKILLLLAIFFTLVTSAQQNNGPWTGIWLGEVGDYYTVILNNDREGYKFINFSFGEQDAVDEYLLSIDKSSLKTRIHNKDNDWNVNLIYTMVDENTLSVEFSGDYNDTMLYHRKTIN
jgi:hypothetical protein